MHIFVYLIFIKGPLVFFECCLNICCLCFEGIADQLWRNRTTWKPRTALKLSEWPSWSNNSPATSTTSQNPLGVPKDEREQGKNVFTSFHSPFYRFPLRKSKIQIPLKWLSQNTAAWHPCQTLILLGLTTITAKITCTEDIQQLPFRRSNFIGFSYFSNIENSCNKQKQQMQHRGAAHTAASSAPHSGLLQADSCHSCRLQGP